MTKNELKPLPFNRIIGHRGAGKQAPENTLASFKKAKELGLNWVEFDIHPVYFAKTLEWVVIHDESVNRTSNGKGPLISFSLDNLKKLDAGSWFHQDYQNEPIPLLHEALTVLQELDLHPNIEIKLSTPFTQKALNGLAKSLINYIKHYWSPQKPWPLISSFHREALIALKRASSPFPLGYLVEKCSEEMMKWVEDQEFFSLHCDYNFLSDFDLDYLLKSKLPILLYTINESCLTQKYLNLGVSAVISDLIEDHE